MASDLPLEARLRTTGEILDDAWRMALADAPLLLALSALFLLPAGGMLLLLWAGPRSGALLVRFLLPALATALLLLTGLGSGACQEVFRRRAEGKRVGLAACLGAALRRGLSHITARALTLVTTGPGLLFLTLTGLVIWKDWGAGFLLVLVPAALCCLGLALGVYSGVQPTLAAGEAHVFAAFGSSGREAQRQPGKAAALAFGRLAVWLFALFNIHLGIQIGLELADTLGGFDVALLELVLSLSNPAYALGLFFLTTALVAPVFEATNYLLHVDAKTRYEGLDLWYRVRRLLPNREWSRVATVLLALAAFLFAAPRATAQDNRLTVVRAARQEIGAITQEVQAAKPYPGGERWVARLRAIAERLNREGSGRPGRFKWFEQAIADFPRQKQERALQTLKGLDSRLALIEQSLAPPEGAADEAQTVRRTKEEIEGLLPPEDAERKAREEEKQRAEKEKRERVRQDDPERDVPERAERRGTAIALPAFAGFGTIGWLLLAGVAVAVLVIAVVLWWQHRSPVARKPRVAKPGVEPSPQSADVQLHQRSAEELWRQADDAARAGRFLEAVRTLYLGVLALLHRANFIRYERTRTNGEYVRQLRPHAEVHAPFQNLTGIFELKFYGERVCAPEDYAACRRMASEISTKSAG